MPRNGLYYCYCGVLFDIPLLQWPRQCPSDQVRCRKELYLCKVLTRQQFRRCRGSKVVFSARSVVEEQLELGERICRGPTRLPRCPVSGNVPRQSCAFCRWFLCSMGVQLVARRYMSRSECCSSKARRPREIRTKRRILSFYLCQRRGDRIERLYSWQRKA